MKIAMTHRALCAAAAAALALSVAGTATAQQTLGVVHVQGAATNLVDLLAQASGLTPRQIQMELGARTAFPEYIASYDFVDSQFRRAVGPEIYQELKSRGEISAQGMQQLTAMINARSTEHLASK